MSRHWTLQAPSVLGQSPLGSRGAGRFFASIDLMVILHAAFDCSPSKGVLVGLASNGARMADLHLQPR